MSIEDWNREFSEMVRRGAGQPDATVSRPDADSKDAIAERRLSIAAALVRLGFIAADRARLDNPAVEVLSELLPPDAELGLCLTCHAFSSSAPYRFSEMTGSFPDVGSFRMNPALAHGSADRLPLLTAPRRELVVCTQVALSWTASRVRSERDDTVTLYSVPFREILGATVRKRHKGVVDVWVEDGPTLSFRVTPEAAEALQAHVDEAAQAQS
jgi:hypothetical protein